MSLITLVEFWWLQMTFRDAGGSQNHTNFARLFELIWLPEDTKEMISVNHILVFVDVVMSLVSNYCLENKSKVTFCATFFVLTLIILKGNIKIYWKRKEGSEVWETNWLDSENKRQQDSKKRGKNIIGTLTTPLKKLNVCPCMASIRVNRPIICLLLQAN